MIINILDHLRKLIIDENIKSNWNTNDKFYLIKHLSIDQRGRVGEHFLKDVFSALNKSVVYVNNAHGDWDIEVNGIKIEVKLATLDVNNKFQHEGIKSSKKWDMVCFIDIAPNSLYLTFLNKNDFEFNSTGGTFNLYGKKCNSHFRGNDTNPKRATGSGYKVDFKLKDLVEVKTIKDIEELFEAQILRYKLNKEIYFNDYDIPVNINYDDLGLSRVSVQILKKAMPKKLSDAYLISGLNPVDFKLLVGQVETRKK
ncbi:hypothetical protein [Mycoplasma nasistruthionis]|uniref:Restriction endonuclease n=1 Tax=Mycoplasma nasistruthionis TaxID=353852 RepID=A0A5B7XUS1_9MOLU|nr:hypothetical protein [Mycoplasma nasistruthionis]QCZ36641.1 hypothetical protein FG904_01235 [Mycoplasma nasistruthionis]